MSGKACGVLRSRESNARRSTQRKGLRRDEAQNCSVKQSWKIHKPSPFWGPEAVPGKRTFVDSSNHLILTKGGKYANTEHSPHIRQSDQSCRHEVWLHLGFVEWRSAQSHLEKHDRRILLKERSAPYHYGKQKGHISDVTSDHSLSS